MIDLHDFKKNIYSQNGEDGILDRLFEEMGVRKGTFCEFGAWDGMYLSNTYALYQRGWAGVYIEGNENRFADLQKNITSNNVELICAFVMPDGEMTLDSLLEKSPVIKKEGRLDLLSIDIDSDDLAIFNSLEKLRASVVVIEYNPTIPIELDYINPRGENKGNSVRSILRAAKNKGYVLVAATLTNLIMVAQELMPISIKRFGIEDFDIFLGPRYFFGYDGTLLCSREEKGRRVVLDRELIVIPWKFAFLAQPVPKMLRHYAQGALMENLLPVYSGLISFLTHPVGFVREGYRWLKVLEKRRSLKRPID